MKEFIQIFKNKIYASFFSIFLKYRSNKQKQFYVYTDDLSDIRTLFQLFITFSLLIFGVLLWNHSLEYLIIYSIFLIVFYFCILQINSNINNIIKISLICFLNNKFKTNKFSVNLDNKLLKYSNSPIVFIDGIYGDDCILMFDNSGTFSSKDMYVNLRVNNIEFLRYIHHIDKINLFGCNNSQFYKILELIELFLLKENPAKSILNHMIK
jgi:hypothetical protein